MPEMPPLGVFFQGKAIFVFFAGGRQCRACNAYAYIQKISYFHAFFDKDHLLLFSAQRKIYFLEKINTIFPDITKKIVFRRDFSEKTIFPEHLQKISYFQVFFLRKIIFPFVSKE